MCTGLEIAALAASAGGAGLTGYAQNQALKKQDEETARGIMRSQELQRTANSRVGQEIAKVKASNPDAERQTATNEYLAALKQNNLTNGGPALATPVGAVSGRFAQDVSSARAGAGADARGLAGTLASIDAPTLQRQREAQSQAGAASDLAELNRQAGADQFLTQLRTSAIQPNPWLMGAGQGLSSFGPAFAGRMVKPGLLKEIKPAGTRIPQGTTTFFGGPRG